MNVGPASGPPCAGAADGECACRTLTTRRRVEKALDGGLARATMGRMPDRHGNFYQHTPWLKLRRRVRIEGNFTCTRCGRQAFGRELHAHHVKPLASARSLALEPLNVRLLCVSCHDAEHARLKRGNAGCDITGNPLAPEHPWNRCRGGGSEKS